MGSLIIIAAMFALLWLLLIRPQRQAAAQRERMTQDVDVGDEILSSGGLYGTVRGVSDDDDELFVEIAPGVEVRMDRRAIGAVVKQDDSEDDEDADEPGDVDDGPDEDDAAAAESTAPEPTAHGTIERDRG